MAAVADRVAEWVQIAEDLLSGPVGAFPVHQTSVHLMRSFQVDAVSFNWWTPEAANAFLTSIERPTSGWAPPSGAELVRSAIHPRESRDGLLSHHPLVRWFAATGRPEAQSMGRVPRLIADSARLGEVRNRLDEYGIKQQLSVPVFMRNRAHEAFVLTRFEGADFAPEDLLVARRIQGFLAALRAQAAAFQAFHGTTVDLTPDLLTAREAAVLALLVQGCTATAIGRRLSMSPRTASKHVQNIYRKLEVRDRVTASRVAESLGLIPPPRRRVRVEPPAGTAY